MTSLSAFSFSSQLFQSQSPVESLIPISSLCEDYSGGALIANNVQRTHSTMYLSSRVQVLSSGVLPPPVGPRPSLTKMTHGNRVFFMGSCCDLLVDPEYTLTVSLGRDCGQDLDSLLSHGMPIIVPRKSDLQGDDQQGH